MTKVSVILPVYNEEKIIERNVKQVERILERDLEDFEIIIGEDGSSDATLSITKKLENERIRVFHNEKRLGKGAALKASADHAMGDIIIFFDADLASNPNEIKKLVEFIEKGADIVIGSRYLKESKAKRDPIRYFASKSFNFLVRVLLGSKITDHQCGFKAFRKKTALKVVGEVKNQKWFWDTEFLIRAQRKGLKIVEVPIEWKEIPGSRFDLIGDTLQMAISLVKFKLEEK